MNEDTKKNSFRSTPYPSRTLSESITDLDTVRKNLGKGSYSRTSVAQSLGHSGLSGAAVRKVAALVHYGLLERVGNTYRYSSLSDRILFPVNEEDKSHAIKEAALFPKLYFSLTDRYSGSAIPPMLENILIQQFKVSDQVAKSASDDFVKTMEFAGLLRNGILYNTTEEVTTIDSAEKVEEQVSLSGDQAGNVSKVSPKEGYTELPALPSGIVILFPEDLAPFASLGRFSEGINLLEDKARELRENI